jgi:hypothetical protein
MPDYRVYVQRPPGKPPLEFTITTDDIEAARKEWEEAGLTEFRIEPLPEPKPGPPKQT